MPYVHPINRFQDIPGKIYTFEELPARVRKNVRKREDGCWIWTGAIDIGGYGRVFIRRDRQGNTIEAKAHRYIYERLVAKVAWPLQLDHLCRVRACCNPTHLEPVSASTNLRRGENKHKNKTHCPRGHELFGDNLYVQPSTGHRSCRICRRAANRQSYFNRTQD